jgi:hypothetical protein
MDNIKIILLTGLAFNLELVLLFVHLVKRAKAVVKYQGKKNARMHAVEISP